MIRVLLTVFVILVPISAQAAETAVDWMALAKAHDAIIRKYRADVRAKKSSPEFTASAALRRAGVANAVDAPVSGITPQKAAAILNDYGSCWQNLMAM